MPAEEVYALANALTGQAETADEARGHLSSAGTGDVGALAVALKRALFEPGLSDTLQKAGAERAKDFSMTALAQRYAQHYMRLATNRPRRDGPPTRESFLRGWRRRMMAD